MEKEDLKNLDFEVVTEPWNKYSLEGHGILRTKFVLIRLGILEGVQPMAGQPIIGFKSKDLFDLLPLEANKGTPYSREYSPIELAESIIQRDIAFKPIQEEQWSVYEADGRKFQFKLVLVKVDKTNKFDSLGEPIYLINTQPIIKIV
jgi:hypothetical protein